MQTAPIKRCQMRASARHKSNSIVALPTLHKQHSAREEKKNCTRQYKALDSALNSLPPCKKKKSSNKVDSQVAYFFWQVCFFPHALLARHLCLAHGASATAQCAVIWSVVFFSLLHFFALHFGGGGVLRLSTLFLLLSLQDGGSLL